MHVNQVQSLFLSSENPNIYTSAFEGINVGSHLYFKFFKANIQYSMENIRSQRKQRIKRDQKSNNVSLSEIVIFGLEGHP